MERPDVLFDLRLGALLGKSLEEIRMLPYPEVLLWRSYYLVEPFGFENIEFHVSQIMAQLFNLQQSKKSKMKSPAHWIRNMPDLVMKAIRREYRKQEQEVQTVEIDLETDEGKKFASEQVIKNIKAMFGNRVVDKRK